MHDSRKADVVQKSETFGLVHRIYEKKKPQSVKMVKSSTPKRGFTYFEDEIRFCQQMNIGIESGKGDSQVWRRGIKKKKDGHIESYKTFWR